MMIRDPLEEWMIFGESGTRISPVDFEKNIDQAMKDLARLEEFLDNPPPTANLYKYIPRGIPSIVAPQLSDSQLSWIEEMYRRVVQKGGTGTRYLQERLLELLALAQSPSTIPFWIEIIDIQGAPRESFKAQRRMIAMAALAYLAIQEDEPNACDALIQLIQHEIPEVRTLAVHYLGETYLYPERSLPDQIQAKLAEVAVRDPAFGPRFEARSILRAYDLPIPLDHRDGLYILKVKFRDAKSIGNTPD